MVISCSYSYNMQESILHNFDPSSSVMQKRGQCKMYDNHMLDATEFHFDRLR